MKPLTQGWKFLITTPLYCLWLCFFQPMRFSKDIEMGSAPVRPSWRRFIFMARMIIVLFITTYPFTILMRLLLISVVPTLYAHYPNMLSSSSSLFFFLTDPIWATIIAIMVSTVVGSVFGIAFGIAFCISGGLWAGSTVNIVLEDPSLYVALSIVLFCSGNIFGLTLGGRSNIRFRDPGVLAGTFIGIAIAIVLGIPFGIAGGYLGGIPINILHTLAILSFNDSSKWGGVTGATVGALLAIGVVAHLAGIAARIVRSSLRKTRFNSGLDRGLSVGVAFCLSISGALGGGVGSIVGEEIAKVAKFSTSSTAFVMAVVLVLTLFGFFLGYIRLPLYPFSCFSSMRAYRESQKDPTRIFDLLRQSALHWDECVPLPLPGLKRMLQCAANQDIEQTQKEIEFIVNERPSQLVETRMASLEITLTWLEACQDLKGISQVFNRLDPFLSHDAGLLASQWITPLAWVNDASREAALYYNPVGLQARHATLNNIVAYLENVRPEMAFEDIGLNKRLSNIVARWLEIVREEIAEQKNDTIYIFKNPYISGAPLRPNQSLFVGRQDLVQQLELELRKGIYRAPLFLIGERRMGKTSTLNHLPTLLSSSYIPISLDLQIRSISSDTYAFLSKITEVIYEAMDARGLQVKRKLEYEYLKEVCWDSDALAYLIFDKWFKEVDDILKRNNKTVLVSFDEFEKLVEVERESRLNLPLLLDWFRSVMQNQPRLALLFSGVKTIDKMASNWATYFVNVKTFKVSLLDEKDARVLITQPISDDLPDEIFGEDVVQKIMRITGCHPFLIQAICSELIDLLNSENRRDVSITDVERAAEIVFESWSNTYFHDLWDRTDEAQRSCLIALQSSGGATLQELLQHTGKDEQTVKHALETLQQRDLALYRGNIYRIVAPIFSTWVKYNSHRQSMY